MSNQNVRAMAEALIKISDMDYEVIAIDFGTGRITFQVPVPEVAGLTYSEQNMCRRMNPSGGKIDAIKSVRARMPGMSLAEAKDFVEKHAPADAYFR